MKRTEEKELQYMPQRRQPASRDWEEEKERRRRQQIRKRRQQIRLRRRRIRRLLTVAAVLVVLIMGTSAMRKQVSGLPDYDGMAGLLQGNRTVLPDPPTGMDPALVRDLQEQYGDNREVKAVLANLAEYPADLLQLLLKRPETLSFVKNYPEKKDKTPPKVDLKGEIKKGEIPLLFQWDERSGYNSYGENMIALAGCGPTCLSMVALGLTGDPSLDPGTVAAFSEKQGYRSEAGTSWDLMTLGAKTLGLDSEVLPLDENRMVQAIGKGRPIICSMRSGDFTDTGHFIVLVDYVDGEFVVHDPNSRENSAVRRSYERIKGQIKNLWAFSLYSS